MYFLSLIILACKNKGLKVFIEKYLEQCDKLDENAQNITAVYEFSIKSGEIDINENKYSKSSCNLSGTSISKFQKDDNILDNIR